MFSLNAINEGFARELAPVDLWKPLDARQISAVRDALREHGVLVFRRQALSEQELADFSAQFGELDRIVRTDWAAEHPAVIRISNMRNGLGESIGGLDSNELDWHTDQSYMQVPATGAVLQMVEMPSQPVDTWWANLKLAFKDLPEEIVRRLESRRGVFQYAKRQAGYGEGELDESIQQQTPDVLHPLINTDGIDDMDRNEADELLQTLKHHVTQPTYLYRHRWRIGDVIMWDNSFLLHRRDRFAKNGCRLLKRTTIRLPAELHIQPGQQHCRQYGNQSSDSSHR